MKRSLLCPCHPENSEKILILASNLRKDLNLDCEIRDLRAVIEQSRDLQKC
ncbi:MAG: hypothetical protein ACKO7W_09455 [Elainella sp.]